MDGSSLSLIIIPVVVVISLAAWLILVAHAASHPQWKGGPAHRGMPGRPRFQIGGVPLPRTEIRARSASRPRPGPWLPPGTPANEPPGAALRQMTDAGAADRRQRDCRANR